MKSKMRITGNRTVIGIICIVLALGITFGIAPLVNRFTDRKVEVVQVKQNVERGHLITEDDVELVKVGALNLSDRTVKNKKYVVGKYAATNLYAGQIMIADLVAEKSKNHCNKVHLFTVIFHSIHEQKYDKKAAISALFLIIPHKSLFVNPLCGTFWTIVFRCTFAQRNGGG